MPASLAPSHMGPVAPGGSELSEGLGRSRGATPASSAAGSRAISSSLTKALSWKPLQGLHTLQNSGQGEKPGGKY